MTVLKKISKSFFGVPEDDEYFNLPAAIDAYNTVMAMDDDEAYIVLSAALAERMPKDLEYAAVPIQKFVDRYVSQQMDTLRRTISKSENAQVKAAVEMISKAWYDTEPRDERGRWNEVESRNHAGYPVRRYQKTIDYRLAARPISRRKARKEKLNLPAPKGLSHEDLAQYQTAYLQVADALNNFKGFAPDDVKVTYHYSKGKGKHGEEVHHQWGADEPSLVSENFNGEGKRLTRIEITPITDASVAGATFDIGTALGSSDAAMLLSASARGLINAGYNKDEKFGREWAQANAPGSVTGRAFGRIQAGSALGAALTPEEYLQTHPKTRIALATGKWVGDHGPEAEMVLGPTARKTAYRYRGVEKKPADSLVNTVASIPREDLIYGIRRKVVGRGPAGPEIREDFRESPLIDYFEKKLPSERLSWLQLQSGNVPPSQGVIINSKGQVVTEAVGYGDDWYLPFNLKNLGRVKGGEYVRTRTYGGPTTEDVYAGLISGARAVTVVSRNGIFTVEFDDTFRGNRRYSDKAARMVGRYGSLLDAVKSKQVNPAALPPEIKEKFEKEAKRRYPMKDDEQKKHVKKLEEEWRKKPEMSDEQVAQVRNSIIEAIALDRGQTPEEMGAQATRALAKQKELEHENNPWSGATGIDDRGNPIRPPFDEVTAISQARDEIAANPDMIFDVLGVQKQAKSLAEKARSDFLESYKPMVLNGPGYASALEALQEQFPYYIAKVTYRPRKNSYVDTGYVNPRFNRPKLAQAGYFDESIGLPKVSAQYTGYQNFANRKMSTKEEEGLARWEGNDLKGARTTSTTSTATGTKPESEKVTEDTRKGDPKGLAGAKAGWAAYQQVVNKKHLFGSAPIDFSNQLNRDQAVANPQWAVLFDTSAGTPQLLSEDEYRRRHLDPEDGPTFRAKMQEAVRAAVESFKDPEKPEKGSIDRKYLTDMVQGRVSEEKGKEYSTDRVRANPNDFYTHEDVPVDAHPEELEDMWKESGTDVHKVLPQYAGTEPISKEVLDALKKAQLPFIEAIDNVEESKNASEEMKSRAEEAKEQLKIINRHISIGEQYMRNRKAQTEAGRLFRDVTDIVANPGESVAFVGGKPIPIAGVGETPDITAGMPKTLPYTKEEKKRTNLGDVLRGSSD